MFPSPPNGRHMSPASEANGEPVCVVGAGPVGLTAALALRSLGVPVRVLDAQAENRVRPGSRALYVHHDSLRTFERISPGLGETVAAHGIQWSGRRTRHRGRLVFAKDHPPSAGGDLPPYASLRQLDTEAHLLDACRAHGVAFGWSAEVEKVVAGAEGVELRSTDGRRWTAPYVVAADGARSVVRAAIGRRMVGRRSASHHVVVDLADPPGEPVPALREFHYHHPGLDGRHVLVVPFAGGRQVDLQCREGEDPDALMEPARLRGWLSEVVATELVDRVLWVSRYPFLQSVADAFIDDERRVLLAGEAAHLFAPFGARGMNSGIADADAAAVAVATALQATDPQRARSTIDDYDAVRRAAALHNRDAAGQALAHMRPSPGGRLRQHLAAGLAGRVRRCGTWLEKAPYGPRTMATPTSTY
ncbi:FAD-dependent monooxygenase [Pseudonocardia xishanensis]|uniref:FAD-dependent monooxygenase n=1 Tax=Pseudonocardia xishanensis TaxID=630995 RepID=A0ABP8S1A4_9PSEU